MLITALILAGVFSAGALSGAFLYREGWHRTVREAASSQRPPPGESRPPAFPRFAQRRAAEVDEDLQARLAAIGYLTGYEEGPADATVHVTPDAEPGWNLYTTGHGPEALLMDNAGNVVHRWRRADRDGGPADRQWWRRVRLAPGGDLLVIEEYRAIYRLDAASNLLWRFGQQAHHDLDVTEDGRVWVLTQQLGPHPFFPGRDVFDHSITILSPEGTLLRSVSILDAFAGSNFAGLLHRSPDAGPDILHTNTLVVLDGRLEDRSPAFRAGNVMVSLRTLDTVAVIDMETEHVVWALAGLWVGQHDPVILSNGNLLVFDNAGRGGKSRVIEVDPFTQEVVWAHPEDPDDPLHSIAMGIAQRLPGGNTLIVESTAGHAVEVTPERRVVWEFWNPERAGDDGEFIATLPFMERLPPDISLDWVPTN